MIFRSLDIPGKCSVGDSGCMQNFWLTDNQAIFRLKGYIVKPNMLGRDLNFIPSEN